MTVSWPTQDLYSGSDSKLSERCKQSVNNRRVQGTEYGFEFASTTVRTDWRPGDVIGIIDRHAFILTFARPYKSL